MRSAKQILFIAIEQYISENGSDFILQIKPDMVEWSGAIPQVNAIKTIFSLHACSIRREEVNPRE